MADDGLAALTTSLGECLAGGSSDGLLESIGHDAVVHGPAGAFLEPGRWVANLRMASPAPTAVVETLGENGHQAALWLRCVHAARSVRHELLFVQGALGGRRQVWSSLGAPSVDRETTLDAAIAFDSRCEWRYPQAGPLVALLDGLYNSRTLAALDGCCTPGFRHYGVDGEEGREALRARARFDLAQTAGSWLAVKSAAEQAGRHAVRFRLLSEPREGRPLAHDGLAMASEAPDGRLTTLCLRLW